MKKGFTLIEVLVAVAIFVSVMVVAGSAFISAIQAQRYNLAYQELLDQTSYVMEHMSRIIRMAKKQLPPPDHPVCIVEGDNYEIADDNDSIKFIDQYGVCTRFFLDTGTKELKKQVGARTTPLTSPNLEVNQFYVRLDPISNQPRVIIDLGITGREETNITIQTSASQRDLNRDLNL